MVPVPLKIADFGGVLLERIVRSARQRVPRVHVFAPGVVLAALLSCAAGGCALQNDECVASEFRCDGRVAMTCEFTETGEGSYHRWRAEDCGVDSCQVDTKTAFCVSLEP